MTQLDRFLAILHAAGGRYTPTDDLVDRLFADDLDGGPLSAMNRIRILAHQARRQGHTISVRNNVGYAIPNAQGWIEPTIPDRMLDVLKTADGYVPRSDLARVIGRFETTRQASYAVLLEMRKLQRRGVAVVQSPVDGWRLAA